MALQESFEEFKINELAHPSHIKLHHPGERKLEYINAMYSNYKQLIKHLKDTDAPQEDIDKIEAKSEENIAAIKETKNEKLSPFDGRNIFINKRYKTIPVKP